MHTPANSAAAERIGGQLSRRCNAPSPTQRPSPASSPSIGKIGSMYRSNFFGPMSIIA